MEGRVDYGYEKFDRRMRLTAKLLKKGKITPEEAEERDRHAKEDYGIVKVRTDEILERREHKVKPKIRIHSEAFYNRIRKENIAKREAKKEEEHNKQIERDNIKWEERQKYEQSPEGIRKRKVQEKIQEKENEERQKQFKRTDDYYKRHPELLPEYVKKDRRERERRRRWR